MLGPIAVAGGDSELGFHIIQRLRQEGGSRGGGCFPCPAGDEMDDGSDLAGKERSALRALEPTPRVGLRKSELPMLEGLALPWFKSMDQDALMNLTSKRAVDRETGRLPDMPGEEGFPNLLTLLQQSDPANRPGS